MMKKSAPARIINTTAAAYQLGEIDFDDINFERREYTPSIGYSQSKLAVAMFTKAFAKKFAVEGNLISYCSARSQLRAVSQGEGLGAIRKKFGPNSEFPYMFYRFKLLPQLKTGKS